MPNAKLRQDTIRSLEYVGDAHGKAQCIHWDAGLPSFGLRIFPNGRGSYVCRYRYQTRQRMADLGRADSVTLEQARKKAKAYFAAAAADKDPQSGIDDMRVAATAKDLATQYLEQHAKLKKRTWKADESFLNRYFVPRLGTHLASSVSRAEISAMHAEIDKTHPYTANHYIGVVRKMFNFGRRIGLVPEEMRNPGAEIERFPEYKRRRYVTPAELPILAKAIDSEPNEFAAHAFWLLLLTGLRRNEILGAKWSDIDWDAKTLFIGKTKNGEAVLTPLSRAAIARLNQIPKIKDNPYIICGAMPEQPLRYLDSTWRRIRSETGFQDLRIHDLRRTVGSWLVCDGASLHLVGAVLNHKDQKTTAGYAYFQTVDRHAALERHGKAILKIAQRPIPQTPQPAPRKHLQHRRKSAPVFRRLPVENCTISCGQSHLAHSLNDTISLTSASQNSAAGLPFRLHLAGIGIRPRSVMSVKDRRCLSLGAVGGIFHNKKGYGCWDVRRPLIIFLAITSARIKPRTSIKA